MDELNCVTKQWVQMMICDEYVITIHIVKVNEHCQLGKTRMVVSSQRGDDWCRVCWSACSLAHNNIKGLLIVCTIKNDICHINLGARQNLKAYQKYIFIALKCSPVWNKNNEDKIPKKVTGGRFEHTYDLATTKKTPAE